MASTGNPVSRTEYDGYGMELPILAGTNTSHRFAGKHGYYKDDSSGLNLYTYCGSGPLTRVDPDGQAWEDDAANFFGGWGSALTFGGTEYVANGINRAFGLGDFSFGGGYYYAGLAVGTAHSFAMGKAGGSKALLQAGEAGASAGSRAALEGAKATRLANWKAAEDSLKALGGDPQKYFNVNGIRRFVDQFANGIIHEAKYGYLTLSKAVRQQIKADTALIEAGKAGRNKVRGGTWHFFRSAQTGKIGASSNVLGALRGAGIKVKFHD